MSIRESLRVLRLLERQARHVRGSGPRLSLEALSFEYGSLHNLGHAFAGSREDYSCGNFVNCFTSLFVARRDMTTGTLDHISNGAPITAFLSHSNIFLYAYGANHRLSKWLSSTASKRQHARLCELLFSRCGRHELPRVFLCSLSIVSPEQGLPDQSDVLDVTSDHKWVIIKHSNSNYQVLQGYIKGAAGVCGAAVDRRPQSLHQWQSSSNAYSSARGNSRPRMSSFAARLLSFATDEVFDSANYHQLFSARLPLMEGRAYWPSLSFQEIDDGCVGIRGFGDRDLAGYIERRLDRRAGGRPLD